VGCPWCRFLVAEDIGVISLALEDTLEDGGYTVAGPFASRVTASAWLRIDTPDVALLDLVLRDGPCFEVARLLQERNVPIVFLSGQMRDDSLPDDLQRLPWIEKPVKFEQLLGALAQAANEKTPLGAKGSSQPG
jgi:DNA-binding response OmpR family regulator